MRTPKGMERVLALALKVWKQNPDMRLIELLDVASRRVDSIQKHLFYTEDDAIERGLTNWLEPELPRAMTIAERTLLFALARDFRRWLLNEPNPDFEEIHCLEQLITNAERDG